MRTLSDLLPYASPLLVGLLALGMPFLPGTVLLGVGALAAAVSLISVRRLTRAIAQAQEQKCYLDRQLIQSQKLASIGELSSGIAHEINNPLAIIGQEVEWIQHLLEDPSTTAGSKGREDLMDSVGEIARQVDRCKEITHKLLDFARKKEPLIQGTDVNRLVEDMARLVEREAVHKNIRIERVYQGDLPMVRTDPPLMRQVILNLLNNATQAIGRDGTITLSSHAPGDGWVELRVRDTGCGISPEHLHQIFDPFFTTKPPGQGTGLGLSICHGIVARLGGEIRVESEIGRGSTFCVRLPVQPKSQEK